VTSYYSAHGATAHPIKALGVSSDLRRKVPFFIAPNSDSTFSLTRSSMESLLSDDETAGYVQAWRENAGFWDAFMGSDGNDFSKTLNCQHLKSW
jgi:hypothetical protein